MSDHKYNKYPCHERPNISMHHQQHCIECWSICALGAEVQQEFMRTYVDFPISNDKVMPWARVKEYQGDNWIAPKTPTFPLKMRGKGKNSKRKKRKIDLGK